MNTDNLVRHGYGALHEDERVREYAIRGYVCPTCEAGDGESCRMDGKRSFASHVRRYELAAADGVVPKLAGVR